MLRLSNNGNSFERKKHERGRNDDSFFVAFWYQFIYFGFDFWFILVKPTVKRLSNINNRNRLEEQR